MEPTTATKQTTTFDMDTFEVLAVSVNVAELLSAMTNVTAQFVRALIMRNGVRVDSVLVENVRECVTVKKLTSTEIEIGKNLKFKTQLVDSQIEWEQVS